MLLAPFIASTMTLVSILYNHEKPSPGIRTCFTNTNKYLILDRDQYKVRENNIHRLSTSIETPSLHKMKKTNLPTYILKYPLSLTTVETYVSENYCSPFILYTIINQCCNNIALYHGLLNCYHSNTTVSNFEIYNNYVCRLSDIETDVKTLTLSTKIEDYDMLFDSYMHTISSKNKHFIPIASMFRKSFMGKMTSCIVDTPVSISS